MSGATTANGAIVSRRNRATWPRACPVGTAEEEGAGQGDGQGCVAGAVHGVQLDQPGQAALARPAGGGVAAHPPGTRPAAAAQRPPGAPGAAAGCRGERGVGRSPPTRAGRRPCRGRHRGPAGPAASVPCRSSCPVGDAAGGCSCPGSRNRPRASGSTRPSATRLSRQRSRWAVVGEPGGGQRRARCTGRCAARSTASSAPAHLPVGAVPGLPAARRARRTAGRPAAPPRAQVARPGSRAQRGERAVQTRAPSSITATFQVAAVAAVVRAAAGSASVGSAAVRRGRRQGAPARRPGPAPGARWCRPPRGARPKAKLATAAAV